MLLTGTYILQHQVNAAPKCSAQSTEYCKKKVQPKSNPLVNNMKGAKQSDIKPFQSSMGTSEDKAGFILAK